MQFHCDIPYLKHSYIPVKEISIDLTVSEECISQFEWQWPKDKLLLLTADYAIRSLLGDDIDTDQQKRRKINRNTLVSLIKKSEHSKISILHAHGGVTDKRWCYKSDSKDKKDYQIVPVQDWIDEQENKDYGAIMVVACNPHRCSLKVRSTPIFYPRGSVGVIERYSTKLLMPKKR